MVSFSTAGFGKRPRIAQAYEAMETDQGVGVFLRHNQVPKG